MRRTIVIALVAAATLLSPQSASAQFEQQGSKLIGIGAIGPAYQGWSVAISADGNTAVGGGNADDSGVGAAWVFTRSDNTWAQQGSKLVGTGASGVAGQGGSVAISADGNTALVGALSDGGKTDLVVYNTSTGVWYGLKSGSNYTTTINISWGGAGYTPIKGDYDGDGKTDRATYVSSTGIWYILLSGANYTTTLSKSWGGAAYTAVPQYP
jgi:hypothetical protein